MTKNLIYLPLGIFTIATLTSGAVLSAAPISAAATCSTDAATGQRTCSDTATATITVASGSCSFSSTGTGSYTVTLSNGQTSSNLGGTTLTAACNDTSAHQIYARGYSNDTAGNTDMISSPAGYNIATSATTGTNTSSWAMKATAVTTGTVNAPTIENGYSSFKAIPANSTALASFRATTNAAVGRTSSITTNFQVYVSSTQIAGTYTGKVKYSLAEL